MEDITYNGLGEPLPWEADLVNKTEPEKLKFMKANVKKWVLAKAGKQLPRETDTNKNYEEAIEIFKPVVLPE